MEFGTPTYTSALVPTQDTHSGGVFRPAGQFAMTDALDPSKTDPTQAVWRESGGHPTDHTRFLYAVESNPAPQGVLLGVRIVAKIRRETFANSLIAGDPDRWNFRLYRHWQDGSNAKDFAPFHPFDVPYTIVNQSNESDIVTVHGPIITRFEDGRPLSEFQHPGLNGAQDYLFGVQGWYTGHTQGSNDPSDSKLYGLSLEVWSDPLPRVPLLNASDFETGSVSRAILRWHNADEAPKWDTMRVVISNDPGDADAANQPAIAFDSGRMSVPPSGSYDPDVTLSPGAHQVLVRVWGPQHYGTDYYGNDLAIVGTAIAHEPNEQVYQIVGAVPETSPNPFPVVVDQSAASVTINVSADGPFRDKRWLILDRVDVATGERVRVSDYGETFCYFDPDSTTDATVKEWFRPQTFRDYPPLGVAYRYEAYHVHVNGHRRSRIAVPQTGADVVLDAERWQLTDPVADLTVALSVGAVTQQRTTPAAVAQPVAGGQIVHGSPMRLPSFAVDEPVDNVEKLHAIEQLLSGGRRLVLRDTFSHAWPVYPTGSYSARQESSISDPHLTAPSRVGYRQRLSFTLTATDIDGPHFTSYVMAPRYPDPLRSPVNGLTDRRPFPDGFA